jgi:hypothetical protein
MAEAKRDYIADYRIMFGKNSVSKPFSTVPSMSSAEELENETGKS